MATVWGIDQQHLHKEYGIQNSSGRTCEQWKVHQLWDGQYTPIWNDNTFRYDCSCLCFNTAQICSVLKTESLQNNMQQNPVYRKRFIRWVSGIAHYTSAHPRDLQLPWTVEFPCTVGPEGWRESSVVKSTCSCRRPEFSFWHPNHLETKQALVWEFFQKLWPLEAPTRAGLELVDTFHTILVPW